MGQVRHESATTTHVVRGAGPYDLESQVLRPAAQLQRLGTSNPCRWSTDRGPSKTNQRHLFTSNTDNRSTVCGLLPDRAPFLVPGPRAYTRWFSDPGPGFMWLNGGYFVIRQVYKLALPYSSQFALTAPCLTKPTHP